MKSPCDDLCVDYRQGDCPGEVWACPEYRNVKENNQKRIADEITRIQREHGLIGRTEK